MEIDVSDYINGSTNEMEKDGSLLKSVPPRASGEGLPYAPADWPNPGDVWTWKVGNKANSSGYYTHRFLIVPKRLQKSPSRKIWLGSKTSVIHYLQSEFPEADVDAFFASFTWEIPTEIRPVRKGATPLNEAELGSQISRRTRSSAKKCISFTANDTTSLMETHLPEGVSVDNLIPNSASNKKNKKSEPDVAISPVNNSASQSALDFKPQDSKSLADYLAEMTAEDFEFYLNSLDDILSDSVSRAPNSVSAEMQMDDFTKARKELSSLLAMGFPSLVNSNKLSEVTNLSSKLQFDPYLSQEELSMLNLIREIPLASKDFLDAKRVTEEASKFFAELEAKKANINERKNEYILSKGKISLLQAEEAAASLTIQEIDEQIAVLQSRKAVLAAVVKTNQKRIADLVSKQKQVFDSVPKIVNDVQMAKSEKSQWESKQKEAAKQEKKILAKFAPLVGFSFVR
ncbi:hypothetical protein DH2020_049051 [Rehmannia glutinosa]|uniref:DUF7081 domain-containing protein n=1 Tax=Rehmannia glutinosa TaxID=99300 RepID=A0ABR0U3U6_REHGL